MQTWIFKDDDAGARARTALETAGVPILEVLRAGTTPVLRLCTAGRPDAESWFTRPDAPEVLSHIEGWVWTLQQWVAHGGVPARRFATLQTAPATLPPVVFNLDTPAHVLALEVLRHTGQGVLVPYDAFTGEAHTRGLGVNLGAAALRDLAELVVAVRVIALLQMAPDVNRVPLRAN